MAEVNLFRHQSYRSTRPTSPHHFLTPVAHPAVGSERFSRRMQRVGDELRDAQVAAIYLVQEACAGAEAIEILAELARVFPSAGKVVRQIIAQIAANAADEVGDYTPGFARCLENSLHRRGLPRIPVRRFRWSSENHHIGRADGAVRLIDELASLDLPPGRRVMLWGHGHAGNVLALMTQLLGGERRAVERFFQASEIYFRWPILGCIDIPVWQRVRGLLAADRSPLADRPLDVVTFGTPIRYGWRAAGYARLLHFVNRRPAEGQPEYRAAFPPRVDDVFRAAAGDYIQQLGIAGTNVTPSRFAWRAWMADSRLSRLLLEQSAPTDAAERFQAGAIVPDEGTTLLVDYGPAEGSIAEHLAGHAVYTRKDWLLFHAEEVVRQLYNSTTAAAA